MSNETAGWPVSGTSGNGPFNSSSQPTGPPPNAKPPKKRVWHWVLGLFILGIAMLGACGAAIGFGIASLARGSIETTNAFMAAVAEERFEDAYNSLCSETQATKTLDQFTDEWVSDGPITGYTFLPSPGNEARVNGSIEFAEEPVSTGIQLTEEDGEWKVCMVTYKRSELG